MRERNEALRRWRVVEEFSEARDKEKGTEDAYVATSSCIAVLDGVSSRGSSERIRGRTPGQLAVQLGTEILNDPSTDSSNVVERLTGALRQATAGKAFANDPSFVFAAFFPSEQVIVRVGDCSYLLDGEGSNPTLSVDRARAIIRQRALLKLRAKGYTDDELLNETALRDRLRGLKAWQEHYGNNPRSPDFGYGVINGKEVPPQFIERIAVSADTKEVVLATDGYPAESLRPTLQETEAALHELQKQDPLAIEGEPSTRPHEPGAHQSATDDRTYLRVKR